MDQGLRKVLEKQSYGIIGEEGAVKTCHWLKEKLVRGRACYKEKFYGIQSHRCLQMTPTVTQCNQNCLFCWRYQGFKQEKPEFSDPEDLLDGAIEAQRRLITGFKGDDRVKLSMWEEANDPNMVAISLAGEPTMYPHLSDFIELCHKRGMTTFLVTNGTRPEFISEMDTLPTQLYVTVAAPNESIYRKLCIPNAKSQWQRLMKTLELLPSLDTRTVIRHTLVDGWNMGHVEEYAKMDNRADPDFIEPKGYVFVGYSRKRLTNENMPSYDKIRAFSEELTELTGTMIVGEQPASRVAVLGKKSDTSIF